MLAIQAGKKLATPGSDGPSQTLLFPSVSDSTSSAPASPAPSLLAQIKTGLLGLLFKNA